MLIILMDHGPRFVEHGPVWLPTWFDSVNLILSNFLSTCWALEDVQGRWSGGPYQGLSTQGKAGKSWGALEFCVTEDSAAHMPIFVITVATRYFR